MSLLLAQPTVSVHAPVREPTAVQYSQLAWSPRLHVSKCCTSRASNTWQAGLAGFGAISVAHSYCTPGVAEHTAVHSWLGGMRMECMRRRLVCGFRGQDDSFQPAASARSEPCLQCGIKCVVRHDAHVRGMLCVPHTLCGTSGPQ